MGVRSDHVYNAAVGSIGLSVIAWLTSKKGEKSGSACADRWGIFVGTWAPTLFGLGNALHQYEQR
ncbi:hypothetical protein [Phytoactinopolyspora halotolerans]|nr:hypothetical protein [Phytoactinopolyspora halotolerans]